MIGKSLNAHDEFTDLYALTPPVHVMQLELRQRAVKPPAKGLWTVPAGNCDTSSARKPSQLVTEILFEDPFFAKFISLQSTKLIMASR